MDSSGGCPFKTAAYSAGGLAVAAMTLSKVLGFGSASDGAAKKRCPAHQTSEHQDATSSRFLSRLAGALMLRGNNDPGANYEAGKSAADAAHFQFPKVNPPVLEEYGAVLDKASGERQKSDSRLYIQLQVLDFEDVSQVDKAIEALKAAISSNNLNAVLYADTNCATAVGLVGWATDPADFVKVYGAFVRKFAAESGIQFSIRPGWTMLGRTYSSGHERDLDDFLFKKPVRNMTKSGCDWAVWYPMRRSGEFYMQSPSDQCRMLLHHAAIGRSYAELEAAFDIRLASYGIDGADNEFVVGLIGKDLVGLSKIVQDMRKTEHTSYYLKSLGPFFVGYRLYSNIQQ